MMIGIMAFLAVSLAVPAVSAFATSPGVTVMTTKHSYTGISPIKVVGHVSPAPAKGTTAYITIKGPHGGAPIAKATVAIVHGAFTMTFTSGGALWSQSGTYTVTATVGTMTGTSTFTYTAA
jgi:hypothetical protein